MLVYYLRKMFNRCSMREETKVTKVLEDKIFSSTKSMDTQ